jgi:hypothetical protein
VLGGGGGIALPDHPAPVIGEAALVAMRERAPMEPVAGDPDRPAYIVIPRAPRGGRAPWSTRIARSGRGG